MSEVSLTRHISSDEPRVLVVDGSRVVRQLIERVLKAELPNAVVIGCGSGDEAARQLADGVFDLVTTSLRLPDMDGLELARRARESSNQAYIPIVVVSGDVQERLVARTLSSHVTDYFDKALGFDALATFIRGYVRPIEQVSGTAESLRAGGTVLDVGCGYAAPTLAIAQLYPQARVLGVDYHDASIMHARDAAAHAGVGNARFEVARSTSCSGK